jgi:serine/threonine protein kinase
MNNDKTVIKGKNNDRDANRSSDEKTRIAPNTRLSADTQSDDKTRVVSPEQTRRAINNNETKVLNDERTRILSNEQNKVSSDEQNKVSSNEQTRIVNTDQKTRVSSDHPTDSSRTNNNLSLDGNHNPATETIINGRFILKESLGVGGMGMVYKAIDLRKEEAGDKQPFIAIKILTSEFKHHPQAFISLQREAQKSQLLSHPNVITVYDFDRDGDLVYMTMEELKGMPLDKLVNDNPGGLEVNEAVKIIHAITEGLTYAHKKGIVHADLKPENVFVTDEGDVKIIDFGIARIVRDMDTQSSLLERFDAKDEIDGLTPAYASLEMLKGKPIKASDDIYALGIISYQLLTGRHPFNKLPADIAFKQGMIFKKLNNVKSYQWKAISKALAFEDKNRLASGKAFSDLFSAKGRNVRLLSYGLILLTVILTISLLVPRETNMDHLYDELKPSQRDSYNNLIEQGRLLMSFNDWNNALGQFEKAHEILPLHSITNESLNEVVNKIIGSMEASTPALERELKLQQVNELLKYKSLSENKLLLAYQQKLLTSS